MVYAPDLSSCLVVATTAVGKTGFSLQCACFALLSPSLSIASQHLLIVQRLGAHSSVASLSICPSSFCSHCLSRVGFCFYTHLLIFLLFLTIWQLRYASLLVRRWETEGEDREALMEEQNKSKPRIRILNKGVDGPISKAFFSMISDKRQLNHYLKIKEKECPQIKFSLQHTSLLLVNIKQFNRQFAFDSNKAASFKS